MAFDLEWDKSRLAIKDLVGGSLVVVKDRFILFAWLNEYYHFYRSYQSKFSRSLDISPVLRKVDDIFSKLSILNVRNAQRRRDGRPS